MAEKEKEEWGETIKVAATDNSDEWGETVAVAPKSKAPSKTGGESGAYVKPITPSTSTSTPTSASVGSKSASWTETINPLGGKQVPLAKPIDNGIDINNIYKKYPALKNLGEVTLKADANFTRKNTGGGSIEYFSPTQDSIRYQNGLTVANPKLGTHGILYDPNTNDEEDVILDMLHGMKEADPKYNKIREEFKALTLKDRGGDANHWYEYDLNRGEAQDGKESWINNYVDGLIRSEISERQTGDYAIERKDNSLAMKKKAAELKNYLKSGGAKPIDGVEQTKITKPKYEPSNFGEILKKAKIGVINPDLDEVVNKSKPMNVGGVEVSIKDKGEPAPMQRSVERKEADEDIDLLVTRTNVVRKMRDQEIDKAKQLQLGLEQIKQKGANLNEQYKVNPTPELEAELNQTVKDLQDTEKAYNRAAFAQDVYEKRILQTSDSIKKLANDKVSDNFYMGLYKGMKGNVDSWEQAASLARMGKAEQIQYAKDQATKAPTKEASGGGGIGEMIGGVIPDIGVSIGFSLAGAPVLGVATVAARQGAQQAAEDFSRVFNEVKSSGLPSGRKDIKGKDIMREATDDEAYDIAIRAAGMGAATGAAEGLVGTLGGGKLIGALASKARTQGGKIIAEKVLDTASDALIAGGMQVGRNAYDRHQGLKTELGEGVMENMAGEVLLSAPINTISGIGEYSKAKKETAVREVFKAINESKSNPYELQKLQSNLDVLKNQGMISNVDYNELNKKAEDYIRVVETIPTEVSDKQKAADLIIERDELEAKKESVDKAFQKPIDEKIDAINDELVVMATPVTLQKNTSQTPENYGTINRNDGKGVVNLTQEEFEAEQAKMQQEEEGTAPVVELTEEQVANNEYISNAIDEAKNMLQKDILSEEEFIKETEGKKGKLRKGLEKLFGEGNYDEYLIQQKNRLNLLNKDPLAYYESMLASQKKWNKQNPEDASEYNIGWYEDIIDRIKQQKATPEAIAGETIKTTTNEKNDEDGKQKRGKDGEEDVTKSVQSEGEIGGNEVDLKENKVLAPEGAVTAAPIVEIEKLRAKEQKELNAAIPNADKYKTDGKVDRNKLTDPNDIKAFDEIYDKYDKLITAPKAEAGSVVGGDVKVEIDDNQPYTFKQIKSPVRGNSIVVNGEVVGGIEYSSGMDGSAEINFIEINPKYKNKGYAKKIIKDILKDSQNKEIIGLATKESLQFWKKIGADFIGVADKDGTIDFKLTETNFNKSVEQSIQEAPKTKAGSVLGGEVEIKENNDVEIEGRKAFDIFHKGKQVGTISLEDKGTHYEVSNAKVSTPNKGIGTEAYKQLISTLDKPLISDKVLSRGADALWRKLEREGLAKYNEETKQFETVKSVEQSLKETPKAGSGGVVDVEHRQNIHDKFREQFSKKGVPDEQITGALALMDARAKSAVSNGEVKTPEEWYRKIADVKDGEFETGDVQYQGGKLKAAIVGAASLIPSEVKDISTRLETPTQKEIKTEIKTESGFLSPSEIDKRPTLKVQDNRSVDFASGLKVTDRNKKSSNVDAELIKQITLEANRAGVDPYTMLAIGLQETGLTKDWLDNPFHLTTPQTENVIRESVNFFKAKLKTAESKGKETEADKIQAWNGYGKITTKSELGGKMYYGIDVSKEPLDMSNNPVYGKRIIDLRDNVLKKNPEIARIVESNKSNVAFQQGEMGKPKGALETLKDGRVVIHALDAPNFSTMVHEIGHIFEKDLTTAEQKIVTDFGGSEPFARGFEKYLRDGKAPTPELKTLFDKFKEWLTNIYKTLKGSPIEKRVTPEIKQIFDRLLTEQSLKETPITEEVVAVEGSTVKLPPLFQGGMERTMVFKDGNWQQEVGGSLNRVGDKVKAEADEAFKASKKAEQKTKPTPKKTKSEKIAEGLLNVLGIENIGNVKNASQKVQEALEATGISVEVLDNKQDFQDKLDSEGVNRESSAGATGVFISKSGKIFIDASKVNAEWGNVDVWHEGTHPIINIIRNTNPKLYNSIVDGLNKLVSSNPDIAAVVEWAKSNYEGENTLEDETIVETIARIANGNIDLSKIPTSLRDKIIDFINEIAKSLGLNPILKNSSIATFKKMAGDISTALKEGKDISSIVGKENVQKFEGLTIAPNNGAFRVDSTKKSNRKPNKNVKLNRPFDNSLIQFTDIDVYEGKVAVAFFGDMQVTADVKSPTDVKLNGRGGGLYPVWVNQAGLKQLIENKVKVIKDGSIWATTDEIGGNKLLNALKRGSLAALATQKPSGVLGNKMMLEHYANLLNKSIDSYKKIINSSSSTLAEKEEAKSKIKELIKAVNSPLDSAFKTGMSFRDKIVEVFTAKSKSKKSTETQKENANKSLEILDKGGFESVEELYDVMYELTYEVRTGFFVKVFNLTNSNKFNIPSIEGGKSYKYDKTILEYANDPIFKNSDYGDIVGFVEYDPKTLRLERTTIEDEFHHKSYHYTIKGDILGIKYLNNPIDGRAVFYESKPKTEGEKVNQTPFGLREKAQASKGIMGSMPSNTINAENIKRRQKSYEKGIIPQFSKGNRENIAANENLINGFYSPLEKTINETKFDKLPAKQWIDKFAKGEEAKWTGLNEWLNQQQGSVSKADIQQFLKDNRIEIKEIVGSESEGNLPKSPMRSKITSLQLEGEKSNYKEVLVTLPNKETKYFVVSEDGDEFSYPTRERAENNLFRGKRIEERLVDSGFKSSHFDERNILVHLRMNTRTDADGNKVLFLEEVQSDWGQEGKRRGFKKPENTQAIEELENEKQKVLDSSKSYQLLNNKTEGNLSVEVFDAIQQEATNMIDNQYSTEESRKKRFLKDIEDTLDYWSSNNEVPKMTQNELSDFYDVYINELENNSKKRTGYGTSYRLASLENKIEDINKKIYDFSAKEGTSVAPFVTDTNAWTKLGLKYALKEAVKQGATKIAWTTGEQQNERYSLEKVADEVRYSKNSDGTYKIIAYKGGENISENKRLNEKDLESNFGKDVAQRIIDGVGENIEGEKSLTGENLKVGGKGMKGFYGSPTEGSLGIVGNVAKSLFKQVPKTVKISKTEQTKQKTIDEETTFEVDENEDGTFNVFISGKGFFGANRGIEGEEIDSFKTKQEAIDFAKKEIAFMRDLAYVDAKYNSTQYSIDITPELKAEVEQGLPQFSKGREQNSQIKDYIESQRAAGESDADIRAGIESVADRIGLTEQDINDLMSTTAKTEDAAATQPTEEKPIKKKKRRKSLLNRAFRGNNEQKVKDAIKNLGLFYETENQAQAKADAKEFIREVGAEAALDAVRNNLVEGGRAAFIYAEVIDNVMIDMANAKNIQESETLLAIQTELLDEFDRRARAGGQFNAALANVYATSDFNYKLTKQIEKYKAINNGIISPEVKAKFEELETQLNEVNEQLKEAESRAKEAEEKAAIDNIKEDVNRNKEKETYTQKAKKVADKFRARFKTKPKFYDENGNEIEVFTAGFTWNDLVEEAAKAIQRTGKVADGLKAVVDFVKDSDVYKKLTKKGQEALDGQINNYFGEEKTSGRVKVPHSLIRRLVEEGNTDMDSLVAAVKQEMLEEYPDATDREIRDGITGYGKTVNQNQEEIEKQIRKLKFLGRAQSALEDIANKKRPLKSGAQRDKLDADERKLLKEIKEAMKDLPVDLETQDAQLKTALDAAKTRLRNKIEDLNKEIESGETAKKNNKPTITDQEYKDLVEQRDELQYQHDLIFKGKPQTVGEKKIKALEKQLDDLLTKEIKGQEASATFSEAEQKQIDALKERINAAKEEMGLIASKPLPKTEMEKAEAREKAKIEALEKQLEDLRQGIIENKKDKAKTQESQEVKDLKAQIQKEKEFLGLIPANPTEIQLMEMVYDKAISDINDKIKNNDLAFKKPENKAFIPELEAKRQLLDAAKAELKKLREEAGIIEARRLENAKNSVNRRIAELERRIREKDFSKKKPTPLIKDNELIRLNAKKLRIKAEFDKLQYQNELNNRNKVQKFYDGLLEVWGLPRALLATGEFSFMLIQGGIYTLGNWKVARSSFSGAMTALANENKAKQQLKYIQAQEWYPVMKASKLALTEPDAKLEAREEQFLGGWVNYIWDIAGYPSRMGGEKLYEGWKKLNPIRAVERAGVSYLNMIRVQKFLEGSEMLQAQGKTFETHPQDYKNVADVVNTFTGRASLGKGEQFSKELSAVFFSPRNWASMIKSASPYALYHIGKMGSREEGQSSLSLLMKGKVTPSVAQKMAVKDFLKYVAITAGFVVMAAIKYNNDDDDETEVNLDGTSSDFLKIKLGNTRVDPWGGKIQQVVLTNRIISSLSGGDGKSLDYAGKMVINKFNPSAAMTYKYLKAERDSEGLTFLDQYGNPISMKEDLWNSVRPIYWQSFAEINKENSTATAGLLHFYGFLGGGTMTYKTPTEIMKAKDVSYDDLEDKDVVDFKQQIQKSAEKYTKKEVEELEVEFAKGVKDIDRQFKKGLIKETDTFKKNLKNIILNDFKASRGVQSADESISSELKKSKDIKGKVDFLINEFAFKYKGKWIVYETLSAQENKIKRWVKKGIIDKDLEKELYTKLSLMNKETLPK